MIADSALEKLENYDYPGNVRELENIIMSAVSMSDDGHVLTPHDISIPETYREESSLVAGYSEEEGSLGEYLAQIEEKVIRQYLTSNGGNVSKTAGALGMVRQNLQHKLKKYDISIR